MSSAHAYSLEEIDTVPLYQSNVIDMIQAVNHHRESIVDNNLCKAVRGKLCLNPEHVAVIFGEQPYFYGGRPKVLAKRILAAALSYALERDMHLHCDLIELFASGDSVTSEDEIYTVQIPSPENKTGVIQIGTNKKRLSSEKTISGIDMPDLLDRERGLSMLTRSAFEMLYAYGNRSLYIRQLEELVALVDQTVGYAHDNRSLSSVNIDAVSWIRRSIGLPDTKQYTDEQLDPIVAEMGGLDFILGIWPKLIETCNREIAKKPDIMKPILPDQAPFWLIHDGRRLRVRINEERKFVVENLQRTRQEVFSKSELVEYLGKKLFGLTFMAVPRVILYSQIFDGHITGGGSRYNEIAHVAAQSLRIPTFPLMHMQPRVFDYTSILATKKQSNMSGYNEAVSAVRENRVGTIDVLLSVGVQKVRSAVRDALQRKAFSSDMVINLGNGM